jgi:hypothetical protein
MDVQELSSEKPGQTKDHATAQIRDRFTKLRMRQEKLMLHLSEKGRLEGSAFRWYKRLQSACFL